MEAPPFVFLLHFVPLAGRTDAGGHQSHEAVPVPTSQKTGCCNLATKAGICGSDCLPTLSVMSQSGWPGTEALISCKYTDVLVHRVAQWAQIGHRMIAIYSKIRGRSPASLSISVQPFRHIFVRATPKPVTHPSPVVPGDLPRRGTKESVCSALYLRRRCHLLLRLPALRTRNHVPGRTQWLSRFRLSARSGPLTAFLKPDYVRWISPC